MTEIAQGYDVNRVGRQNEKLAENITNLFSKESPERLKPLADALKNQLSWEISYPDGTTGAEGFSRLAKVFQGSFQSTLLDKLNAQSSFNPKAIDRLRNQVEHFSSQEIPQPIMVPPIKNPQLTTATSAPIEQKVTPQEFMNYLKSNSAGIGQINNADWNKFYNESNFKAVEQSIKDSIGPSFATYVDLSSPDATTQGLNSLTTYQSYINRTPDQLLAKVSKEQLQTLYQDLSKFIPKPS